MHGRFFRLLFTGLALCLLWVSSASAQGPEMRALREEIHRRGTPPIALVLSGGGAKGLAHIGVLDVLDSAGIPIDLIVGTSMGAAIGGLYAAGYTPKELVKFAESTNWVDVLDFDDDSHRTERRISQKDNDNGVLSLRFTGFFKPVFPQAISSGQRLTMLLNSMVINAPHGGAEDFTHDLHVPFIALATDIVTGNRRLITHGDLTSAMRASITLPLRFTPLSEDSAILVDGGLLSNVPVDVAKDSAGADIVIASNTTAGMRPREDLTTPWDVADQVMTLMMQRLSREALRRADAVITPEIQLGAVDFQDVPAIIESGRIAARKMLPRLLELTAERRHSDHNVSGADNGELMLDILGKVTVQTYGLSVPDTVIGVLGQLHHDRVTRQSYQNQIAEPLLSAFRSRGYTLARIDSVCIYPGERTLELFVDEGRIANIMIAGNAAAHPEVVLREFPLSRGEVFRSQDAERGLHNLTSTGYYDFASIEIIRDEAWQGTTYQVRSSSSGALRQYDTLRRGPTLKLTVQERAPSVLRLGIFADNEYGAQFSTELTNENVFGWGASISLKGGVGALNRYAALTFEAPRLLRSNLTMMLQGYTNYKDISVYATVPEVEIGKIFSNVTDVVRESHDYGMRIKVGGEVGRIAELSVEMRKEQQSFYSVRDAQSGVSLTHVTALKGEIDIDSRNDREFPQFGTYFSGFYEVGNKLIGGENSYTKIYALLEQAIPLSSLHTIIPRFTAGFGDLTLPRMEQFGLGGVESFYGLNDLESRGRQVLSGSLTYQIGIPHALLFPTFVSLRYDIGATWLQPEAIKFEALVHGLGIGIGFKTPLGLARFAIGENFRFNKTSTSTNELLDLNKPRFYFSIGSNL